MASAVVDSIGIEDDALETLYATFAEPLRRFCRSRLEGGRQDEAEDACHETLLRASNALPRFRSGEPLWPWLATIAANVCKDMTRNDRRFGQLDVDAIDPAATPEDELDRRDRAAIVVAAMGAVPLHYRKALYLQNWEDLSWADIARLEGKSVASVRSTLMRARRVLRGSIRQEAERVHQWPLPTVTPRGWARPFLRFREKMAQWYPSAPERALALLPVPALGSLLASGGSAIAEGGVALILAVGIAHGGAAAAASPSVSVPPPLGPPGERVMSLSASASVGSGGAGASIESKLPAPPLYDRWWQQRDPDVFVPVGSGSVSVKIKPSAWGAPAEDGGTSYSGPSFGFFVEPPVDPPKEANKVPIQWIHNWPTSYCPPPDRRNETDKPRCDGLEATTQL